MAVASTVAMAAMIRLLTAPIFHLSLHTVVMTSAAEQSPTMSLYQRTEKASGSSRNMPGVKSRKGAAVNDRGMTAMSGITRKNSTSAQ